MTVTSDVAVTWTCTDRPAAALFDCDLRRPADCSDDDSGPDTRNVPLSNLSDNGTVSVGASDLNDLLPGDVHLSEPPSVTDRSLLPGI